MVSSASCICTFSLCRYTYYRCTIIRFRPCFLFEFFFFCRYNSGWVLHLGHKCVYVCAWVCIYILCTCIRPYMCRYIRCMYVFHMHLRSSMTLFANIYKHTHIRLYICVYISTYIVTRECRLAGL